MATDTAAPSEARSDPRTPASSPRRQYWQLPVFCLGMAAAIVAYKAYPPVASNPRQRFDRELADLRSALEKRPLDTQRLIDAVRNVSNQAPLYPEEAPLTQFLLGSGYLTLAEHSGVDADEYWQAANREFSKCDLFKLTDKLDQQRCIFRSAKAAAAVGVGDPKIILAALSVIPAGEDPGERSRWLGEAHLRSVPPDWKRARDEFAAFLSGPNRAPPAVQARYKLKLAEVCLSVNELDRARSWLKEIGPGAPPEVAALAKVQLGRLAAAENNWSEAVKLFEEAQATPGVPADQVGVIKYETGRGWLALSNPVSAQPYFEQAEKLPGPVSAAARLRLAELAVRDPALRGHRNRAADWISAALPAGTTAADYRNPHMSLDELRAGFEEVIQVSLNEGDHASAWKAATAYRPIAPPGRDRERRAEINAAWAAHLERHPDSAATARLKRQQAAEDYLAWAGELPAPAAKIEAYRKAALCLRKAGDDATALKTLDQILMTPGGSQDSAGAAHLEKGEIFLANQKYKDALESFEKAKLTGGIAATLAQVKQARAVLDEGKKKQSGNVTRDPRVAEEARIQIELAQQSLNQIAGKTYETAIEREAQQEALFELGKIFVHQSRNYAEAEARFNQLIQLNPTGPYSEDAKLYLGTCLLLTARGENGRPAADAERKLLDALSLFQSLTDSKRETIQTQADLRVVRALYLLRRFDDMPKLCGELAVKYKGRVEELIVLSMLYWGYKQADRMKLAEQTLARMQEVYQALPDEAFTGMLDEYTRNYWEKVHVPALSRK